MCWALSAAASVLGFVSGGTVPHRPSMPAALLPYWPCTGMRADACCCRRRRLGAGLVVVKNPKQLEQPLMNQWAVLLAPAAAQKPGKEA